MSYPYPYHVDRDLWASFSLYQPDVGEIVPTPEGEYFVLAVLPGRHCSTGLMMAHPELDTNEVPSGWFWYGVRVVVGSDTDNISELALSDWRAMNNKNLKH